MWRKLYSNFNYIRVSSFILNGAPFYDRTRHRNYDGAPALCSGQQRAILAWGYLLNPLHNGLDPAKPS
jgi:hypothetical protein